MSNDEHPPQSPDLDDDITGTYANSLLLHVGAVAVMGARVEVALVRMLRHLEPHRLSEPHKEVMWLETEKAIRQGLARVDTAVAAEVLETLDWASALDLRGRRNDVIHTEYPILPGKRRAVSLTRIARDKHGESTVAPYDEFFARLRETQALLASFAARLEAVTYWMMRPSWHRRVMRRPGGSAKWRPSAP
ncbi:hypothetical protein [Cellulomonas sp. Root137]|uniref:hypothetical protein n=1 Tax=Cellulomonas sp. Root137 TaxID=1736459 RepID=UPI0006FEA506|nr:hypothetical protein [Cellulomonas sp. Root137]KQY46734.1 hypothetical protein ASD18_04780 [Cellulomonas sp. Root137]